MPLQKTCTLMSRTQLSQWGRADIHFWDRRSRNTGSWVSLPGKLNSRSVEVHYESGWFILAYKITRLEALLFKLWSQDHLHQNHLRGHWICILLGPSQAVESEVSGGLPERFWTPYKLSRRLLEYSMELWYNKYLTSKNHESRVIWGEAAVCLYRVPACR